MEQIMYTAAAATVRCSCSSKRQTWRYYFGNVRCCACCDTYNAYMCTPPPLLNLPRNLHTMKRGKRPGGAMFSQARWKITETLRPCEKGEVSCGFLPLPCCTAGGVPSPRCLNFYLTVSYAHNICTTYVLRVSYLVRYYSKQYVHYYWTVKEGLVGSKIGRRMESDVLLRTWYYVLVSRGLVYHHD